MLKYWIEGKEFADVEKMLETHIDKFMHDQQLEPIQMVELLWKDMERKCSKHTLNNFYLCKRVKK
jgi:hypothetical protein